MSITVQTRNRAETVAPANILHRKCNCGGWAYLTGDCDQCRRKKDLVRHCTANQAEGTARVPIVNEVLRSCGQPLDAPTRAFMEPRFGHDFSGVRVHTDARAAESAGALNALAYTVGRDVVFGPEQYAPQTASGRRLLAHELTHVLQQRGRKALLSSGGWTRPQDQSLEREADRSEDAIIRGLPVAVRHHLGTAALQEKHACLKPAKMQIKSDPVINAYGRVGRPVEMEFDWDHNPAKDCL